jgi:RNA-directed DNA polymerase
MSTVHPIPEWLLRPLPANATVDAKLHAKIDKLSTKFPNSIKDLSELLEEYQLFSDYDAAVNHASIHVWNHLEKFYSSPVAKYRGQLIHFARDHMTPQAQGRILRRLSKDPILSVRLKTQKVIESIDLREVALPIEKGDDWDPSGWLTSIRGDPLASHKSGKKIQEQNGVPVLLTIGAVRKLLNIKSEKQLGYFLLASDAKKGPYTKFTIPKRDENKQREICAPKPQLRWIQRQILDQILSKIPVHDTAHGFIPGRSTVTNAQQHVGAEVILKFDLTDFFPTIHYYRVVGLFASFGYTVGNTKFTNEDDSKQVAPTLARLCCYTPNPQFWGEAKCPQGAPTSPAISNLVCRRLDARLEGLAQRCRGVYTRYADDLTFSFKKDPKELGRFRWWVDQICHQEGFLINQSKFRVIRSSQRQLVTGIVVNDDLRIPREERRRFRAIVHNCEKHGIESQAKGNKKFPDYLRGFASYIHMVHPDEGKELLAKVESLLGPDTSEPQV